MDGFLAVFGPGIYPAADIYRLSPVSADRGFIKFNADPLHIVSGSGTMFKTQI